MPCEIVMTDTAMQAVIDQNSYTKFPLCLHGVVISVNASVRVASVPFNRRAMVKLMNDGAVIDVKSETS